jgi:hypothetical protein
MHSITIVDGVDVDAEIHKRVARAPQQVRVIYAISIGWNSISGIQRALSASGHLITRVAVLDHVRRLRADGIVTDGGVECLLADIPAPGGIIDGLGE